ncbi:hypothetical protein X975_06859, partial [Stegodyphus mimosarum]
MYPCLIHQAQLIPLLSQLLDQLDKFNRLAPGLNKEDSTDLLWHGIPLCDVGISVAQLSEDSPIIHKA